MRSDWYLSDASLYDCWSPWIVSAPDAIGAMSNDDAMAIDDAATAIEVAAFLRIPSPYSRLMSAIGSRPYVSADITSQMEFGGEFGIFPSISRLDNAV